MTNRERWLNALTFQTVDKVPLTPGNPRESTMKRWKEQGFPQDGSFREVLSDALGLVLPEFLQNAGNLHRMNPQFEEQVLAHRDGHFLIRDWMGAVVEIADCYDPSYLRSAKDFVTRRWVKCPVTNRDEWQEMRKRYEADDPLRLSLLRNALESTDSDRAIYLCVNGPFWQLREWLGFEGLCYAMADDPDFVLEMTEFWKNFIDRLLVKAAEFCKLDHIMINEDMAYKAHAMISPQMTRQFVLPCYIQWKNTASHYGNTVFEIDSDGYIGTLLPLWLEAGVNCNSPVEVAAHNDICAYRKSYGNTMAFRGGIDKRQLARGGKEMRDEVLRVVPTLLRRGGYIPACDHAVPPDISWQNFVQYATLLAQLCGWK